jgi:beta-lactamase class A
MLITPAIKITFGVILLSCISFSVGYYVNQTKTNLEDPNNIIRLHQSNQPFINPLLDFHPPLTPLQKNDLNTLTKKINIILENAESKNVHASVYYRDLKNGPWILINGETLYTPASLLKVPIMMAIYKLAEQNSELLDEEITYSGNFAWAPTHEFIDTKNPLRQGEKYSVQKLIEKMIVDSDNIATLLLQERFGNSLADQLLAQFNLPLPPLIDTYASFITIRDYASFFRILYNATYLNHTNSNAALSLLSHTTFTQGIKGVAPNTSIVSNKFGIYTLESEGQIHDCGIVYNNQQHYIICIMTKGPDPEALIDTIRKIAGTIFSFKENTLPK